MTHWRDFPNKGQLKHAYRSLFQWQSVHHRIEFVTELCDTGDANIWIHTCPSSAQLIILLYKITV